jgi:hypothetical protein
VADAVFDGAALARLGAATEAANVLLGAAEANTLRLVGGEGAEALLDALIEKPVPTPVSGPVCTAANEPISMDEAISRAIAHTGVDGPMSVSSSGGFQMMSSTVDANGNIITKISRFNINPESGHVQRPGEHLNLETQINGVPVTSGPLADPHTPINPSTIRPGDVP